MQIFMTNDRHAVERYIEMGFCPVECSIGGESLVDHLQMDHHGTLSHLESVAVRAYRDHFGARREDPRFVSVGVPDADCTFAIAALAGVLPHPSRLDECKAAKLPPFLVAARTADFNGLATTIGILDTEPIGRNKLEMDGGVTVMAWHMLMAGGENDSLDAYAGVQAWRQLCANHPARKPMLDSARESERLRHESALMEMKRLVGTTVAYVDESEVFGFEEWYKRVFLPGHEFESASGWFHPCVIARTADNGNITIGCPNVPVAEALFGPGGLKVVFPKLNVIAPGWGGREVVGGSPRGMRMTSEQLVEAARIVESCLLPR